MSLTSTTARLPYSSVNTIMEVSTCAAGTPGGDGRDRRHPAEHHPGWRPISVKIQPIEFPNSGSSGSAMKAASHHLVRGGRRWWPDLLLRRNSSMNTPIATEIMPRVIIIRKVQ